MVVRIDEAGKDEVAGQIDLAPGRAGGPPANRSVQDVANSATRDFNGAVSAFFRPNGVAQALKEY
jgi:hypothetical protein